MAIGVAMLGFGFSGTVLALWRNLSHERARVAFGLATLATPIALLASVILVHRVPLDASQLPWDPSSWVRLAIVYVLLALPFAVGALAVLLGLTLEPERVGALYGASFLGSGLGAAASLAILWVATPERALGMPALAAALAALAVAVGGGRRLQFGAGLVVLLALAAFARPLWRIEPSPYKGLPQVEAYPDARRVAERTSPLGWVVAVEASAFRHAPGLSLAYGGEFPRQTALFVDADLAGAASDWGESGEAARLLDWLPSAMPYALGRRDEVLVVGAGGGTEVWNALWHQAEHVTAAELNPALPELAGWFDGARRAVWASGEVGWEIGDARNLIARSDRRFDLIVIGPGRGFGTAAAGVHALGEDFLHTTEAYSAYLDRLDEGGVLAITRWLTVPPRESLRVILTAVEALRRVAPRSTERGLVIARSWATGTVLVKPDGFSEAELEAVRDWSVTRRFDLDYYPGIEAPVSRFNKLDEPLLFRAAQAAMAGADSAAGFVARYEFDVAPARDARPYPHHFLRLGSVGTLLRAGAGSWLPFAEWGYVSLLATLAQSVVVAALLLLLPAALGAGRAGAAAGWLRLIGYFSAIGLAYLAAEVAAIQQLQLLLGHPVYAVAATLAAFLICSGLGSAWSDRWRRLEPGWAVSGGLALLLAVYAAATLGLVHATQSWPLPVRALAALLILTPLALAMGFPFPLGLRRLAAGRAQRVAWAWAANGFASVVAAPLGALIALEAGSRTLLLFAAGAYVAAALFYRLGTGGAIASTD